MKNFLFLILIILVLTVTGLSHWSVTRGIRSLNESHRLVLVMFSMNKAQDQVTNALALAKGYKEERDAAQEFTSHILNNLPQECLEKIPPQSPKEPTVDKQTWNEIDKDWGQLLRLFINSDVKIKDRSIAEAAIDARQSRDPIFWEYMDLLPEVKRIIEVSVGNTLPLQSH